MIIDDKPTPVEPGPAHELSGWLRRQPDHVLVRWLLLSCALLALGSIGTWAKAQVDGFTVSASGISATPGRLTLAAALLTAVPVAEPAWIRGWGWGSRHHLDVSIVLGWIAVAVCLYNLLTGGGTGLTDVIAPGWGLYLATVSSASLIVWSVALRRRRRAARTRS
jgi:hypothetical protein